MTSIQLPSAFNSLQDLVSDWVLPTEQARMFKRHACNFEEITFFYERMMPLLPEILEYLNNVDPGDLSPSDELLLNLTLFMADASMSVEKVKAIRSDSTFRAERLEFIN